MQKLWLCQLITAKNYICSAQQVKIQVKSRNGHLSYFNDLQKIIFLRKLILSTKECFFTTLLLTEHVQLQ